MKNVFVETKWLTNKKENKSFYKNKIEMKESKDRERRKNCEKQKKQIQ
jgi:hypothetical protein